MGSEKQAGGTTLSTETQHAKLTSGASAAALRQYEIAKVEDEN